VVAVSLKKILFGGGGAGRGVPAAGVTVSTHAGVLGGIQYTVFAREDLGVTFGVVGRAVAASSVSGSVSVESLDTAYVTMPIGVRWNPFTAHHPESQLKPFVGATIGPAFGGSSIVRYG